MAGILEGIRVVDFTAYVAGPFACALLGDSGAEVIRVEPLTGDPFRGVQTFMGTNVRLPNGKNVLVEDVNRNKKSVAVDLTKPRGEEIIRRLVTVSDVFITNYRLKACEHLGLDYNSLREVNPRLIYGNISAFGNQGPLKDAPGLDLVGMAVSGAMLSAGEEGMPPVHLPPGSCDRTASLALAYGVVGALLARERFGVGQEVSTSLLGAMAAIEGCTMINYLRNGQEIARHNRAKEGNPLYNWYRCKEGAWIALADVRPVWPALCRALGLSWLETDPRFVDRERRAAHSVELIAILDAEMAKRTSDEWLARFRESGDVIVEKINSIADTVSHPQMYGNRYLLDWEHPTEGTTKVIGFPVTWTETPAELRLPPPELGEHTESILVDVLNYSWDEIVALKDNQVVL